VIGTFPCFPRRLKSINGNALFNTLLPFSLPQTKIVSEGLWPSPSGSSPRLPSLKLLAGRSFLLSLSFFLIHFIRTSLSRSPSGPGRPSFRSDFAREGNCARARVPPGLEGVPRAEEDEERVVDERHDEGVGGDAAGQYGRASARVNHLQEKEGSRLVVSYRVRRSRAGPNLSH